MTAGASGIGRKIGEAFAASGWSVWVTDVDTAALPSCPAVWRAESVDVAGKTAMAALFSAGRKRPGPA
jgi:NAD(P)-dependent dehydrogenase (short-subunit alcohol dehydrogenase family)